MAGLGCSKPIPALNDLMQEHLHVGRQTWKRITRTYLILLAGIALPFVLGIRQRGYRTTFSDVGEVIPYDGIGGTRYYAYQPGTVTPLFILAPPFIHWNIHGMRELGPKGH